MNLDPNAKHEYSDEMHLVGSYHVWAGNDSIGEGRIEITALDTNKQIDCKLTFIKPFESEAMTAMFFEETEEGTKVTWNMTGNIPFPIGLFMPVSSMDGAVGDDYENGLKNLKVYMESQKETEPNNSSM